MYSMCLFFIYDLFYFYIYEYRVVWYNVALDLYISLSPKSLKYVFLSNGAGWVVKVISLFLHLKCVKRVVKTSPHSDGI